VNGGGQWREQEAYMQSTFRESTGESRLHQLSPLLDEAMARLGKKSVKPWYCEIFQGEKPARSCRGNAGDWKRRPKAGCIARWRSCTDILPDAA